MLKQRVLCFDDGPLTFHVVVTVSSSFCAARVSDDLEEAQERETKKGLESQK